MSKYWNARTQALKPYVPGEQPRDRRYIKLNTNENPYPPSPATLQAMREAATEAARLYPDPTCLELRQAIAEAYGVRVEEVFVGNGSDEILALAFGAFFGPGEDVLFPDVTYSFYPVYAALWGVPYREVPLAEDFSIRIEDYLQPSGGVIFPNPNAPTARSLSREEILKVVAHQEKAGRVAIVDEAYVDFGAESVVSDIGANPNLLVIHTLSKFRALAGLRVGYAIGQAELIQGLERVKDSFNSYTLDRVALAGAVAAIRDTPYYRENATLIARTRERVRAALLSQGFLVLPSGANFIFATHPRVPGEVLFRRLREQGILVRHFRKPRIENYVRVSIGTDEEMDAFIAACAGIVGA